MKADVIILNTDLTKVSKEAIRNIKVDMTIKDGAVAFDRKGSGEVK